MTDPAPAITEQATLHNVDVNMLREFRALADQAAGARDKIRLVDIPGLPDGINYYTNRAGELHPVPRPAPWRKHQLHSVGEVAGYLQHLATLNGDDRTDPDDPDDVSGAIPVVWYSSDAVVIVLDDDHNSHRRDRVTCQLLDSDQYQLLLRCEQSSPKWSQREFVHILRTVLWDAIDDVETLLKQVRHVTTRSQDATTSSLQTDHSSYGRSIEQGVTTADGKLPETVTCKIRLFDDVSLNQTQAVRCALDIDPVTRDFSLTPLSGQLNDALNRQMDGLGNLLHETGAPVFYGRP